MATGSEIREGIAANLNAITGCQVSAWRLDNPTPPTLHVLGRQSVSYDQTYGRGTDSVIYLVQGLIAKGVDPIGAQRTLDLWTLGSGDQSVKAAIESDKTLGGVVDSLRVTSYEGDREYTLPNGTELFGGEWAVEIIVSPT